MGNKYTIVLPTNVKSNFDLLINNNFKFLNTDEIEEFMLVCNQENVDSLKKKTSHFNVKVMCENEFLNESVRTCKGWFKQQLIKLGASSVVKTEHYLVLDDDLFLVKRLNYNDFFHEGKIIYSHEGWPDNGSNYSTNTRWWENSCDMLKYDVNKIKDSKFNMSVTPQLFKTMHVKSLIQDMQQLHHDEDWQKIFMQHEATEFCSYWIHLLKSGSDKDYTPRGSKIWDLDKEINIVEPHMSEQCFKQTINNAYLFKRNHFFVIQSYLNYPMHYYNNIIGSYMNIDAKVKQLIATGSDINEHLQTLINYSKQCESIVELGTGQTISTWAFLAARPKSFVTVDIMHPRDRGIDFDEIVQAANNENVHFELKIQDSRTVDVDPMDLLFIDTQHNYDVLKQELHAHGNKASKYIIFHDTIAFGTKDEFGDGPGLIQAIQEFLHANVHWKEKETWTHNNGLTVLHRVPTTTTI
jgi:hypothetical protein